MPSPARVPLFDFDGTLVDSDVALMAPFLEPRMTTTTTTTEIEVVEGAGRAHHPRA